MQPDVSIDKKLLTTAIQVMLVIKQHALQTI